MHDNDALRQRINQITNLREEWLFPSQYTIAEAFECISDLTLFEVKRLVDLVERDRCERMSNRPHLKPEMN